MNKKINDLADEFYWSESKPITRENQIVEDRRKAVKKAEFYIRETQRIERLNRFNYMNEPSFYYDKDYEEVREYIEEGIFSEDLIAECIYCINKEAKRYRDMKHEMEYMMPIEDLKRCKPYIDICNRKNELYNLKNVSIYSAIEKLEIEPTGYHIFYDGPKDLYVIGVYRFHIEENRSENCLGEIRENIKSVNHSKIQVKCAEEILKRFIRE